MDGDEDNDHDGQDDGGNETHPLVNTDDIPKALITIQPASTPNKMVKVGSLASTFVYREQDGSSPQPVLTAPYNTITPYGDSPMEVFTSPEGDAPSPTWTGGSNIVPSTGNGVATFTVNSGHTTIISGETFIIDTIEPEIECSASNDPFEVTLDDDDPTIPNSTDITCIIKDPWDAQLPGIGSYDATDVYIKICTTTYVGSAVKTWGPYTVTLRACDEITVSSHLFRLGRMV